MSIRTYTKLEAQMLGKARLMGVYVLCFSIMFQDKTPTIIMFKCLISSFKK